MSTINSAKLIAKEAFLSLKKYAYLVGILMTVLGVCVFLRPISASVFFVWVLVVGLLINGISRIVMYFKLPVEARSGWFLALAIIWFIAAVFLIADALNFPLHTTISIQAIVGIIIGFNCIFSGVSSIGYSRAVAEAGGSRGMCIFSGVLEIICGMIVMSSPIMGLYALTIAFGLYLIIMGVSTIIRAIAY